jgi:plasmid stability protein
VASLTVRKLDDTIKARLRVRAARHGRSMEDEVRVILRRVVAEEATAPADLASAIRRRFAPFGGVDLPHLARDAVREPPGFGG